MGHPPKETWATDVEVDTEETAPLKTVVAEEPAVSPETFTKEKE